MAFLTATANAILDLILNQVAGTFPAGDLYVSLHTGDPGESGTNEVVAGGNAYARKQCNFSAAGAKASSNSADLEWTNMPGVTITHVGLWSALTNGTFWWAGAVSPNKTVSAGDTFKIPAGDLDVTLT